MAGVAVPASMVEGLNAPPAGARVSGSMLWCDYDVFGLTLIIKQELGVSALQRP